MILDDICSCKSKSLEKRMGKVPFNVVYNLALQELGKKNNFKKVLVKDGLSIIGEYKRASPSKGVIVNEFNIENILAYYKKLNIDAYSVLTEEDYFKGSDEYLKKIKYLSNKPILRKDFILNKYQVYESKALGASGILLIVAVLKGELKEFYDTCKDINLYPLVEVHNREELDLALDVGAEIIGINNRDLKTFNTCLNTTKDLIKYIPKDKIVVSESGIYNLEDLKKVNELGVNAVLIGEMFMRNINNENFIKSINEIKDY